MVTIRHEKPTDIAAREGLLDEAFGVGRTAKTAERLRAGRLPVDGLSFVAAERGNVVGTARCWHVAPVIGHPALLLGPLAVATTHRGRGIGTALMLRALRTAHQLGHCAVLLVGDAPYYERFGFSGQKTGALWLPGPFTRERLLGLELVPGALDGAEGLIRAAGTPVQQPSNALPQAA